MAEKDLVLYFYVLIVNTVFMFICIPVLLNNISLCWKLEHSKTYAFPINKCSDYITNGILTDIRTSLHDTLRNDTALFFLMFLNWSIPLYLLTVIYIKKDDSDESVEKDK